LHRRRGTLPPRRRRSPLERLRGHAMILSRRAFLTAAGVIAIAPPARAAAAISIVGGRLLRPGEPPLDDAVITLEEGKIAAIGGAAASETIDARGKIVTAGLVDLLTQIGVVEVDLERTSRDNEH